MTLDLFTGAAAGAVLDAKDKALGLEFYLERLEITLTSVIPHVYYMQQLDEELNRPSLELARLVLQLETGKELIRKCSVVTCANYYKRYNYSERILKLDASLQRFFNMEMQVTMSRDVKETLKEVFTLRQELCEMRNGRGGGTCLPHNQLHIANSGQQSVIEFEEEEDHSIDLSNTSSSMSNAEEGGGTGSNSFSLKELAAATKSDEEQERLLVAAENRGRAKLYKPLGSVTMKTWDLLLRFKKENKNNRVSRVAKLAKGRQKLFSFGELRAATDNFSVTKLIGKGGFGEVYLGELADGQKVAIKRTRGAPGLEIEVDTVSGLHHKHLVRIVGFCDDENDNDMLLVYEFMENGSLDNILHPPNSDEQMSVFHSWKMRVRIALEVARAIDYLHNHSVPCIIHRDIKPSNILLDVNWTAKISDFGFAVSMEEKDDRICGTVGYIAPEYMKNGELTVKADVYSLGVVLLELLTGKKAIQRREFEGCFALPRYVAKLIDLELELEWEMKGILDSRLRTSSYELHALEMVLYTAMWCLDVRQDQRPSITQVMANLENAWACFEHSQPHSATQCVNCLYTKRPSTVELAIIIDIISHYHV